MEKNEILIEEGVEAVNAGSSTIKRITSLLGIATLSVIMGAASGCKRDPEPKNCMVRVGQCLRKGDVVQKDGAYFCDTKPYLTLHGVGCDKDKNEFLKAEVGQNCTVGQGACMRPGVLKNDENEKVTCMGVPAEARPEICNGIDDNCDGVADEGLTCTCIPSHEICDGQDNNCNGKVDEGYNVGTTCSVGEGDCARTGIILCDTEGGAYCSAKAAQPKNGKCEK